MCRLVVGTAVVSGFGAASGALIGLKVAEGIHFATVTVFPGGLLVGAGVVLGLFAQRLIEERFGKRDSLLGWAALVASVALSLFAAYALSYWLCNELSFSTFADVEITALEAVQMGAHLTWMVGAVALFFLSCSEYGHACCECFNNSCCCAVPSSCCEEAQSDYRTPVQGTRAPQTTYESVVNPTRYENYNGTLIPPVQSLDPDLRPPVSPPAPVFNNPRWPGYNPEWDQPD